MREYEALRAQHEQSLMRQQTLYAAIQATLHNAHFEHPNGKSTRFTPEDFLPGGRKPQSGEDQLAAFQSMIQAAKAQGAFNGKNGVKNGR